MAPSRRVSMRLVVIGLLVATIAAFATLSTTGLAAQRQQYSTTRNVGIDHEAVAVAYGAYTNGLIKNGQQASQATLDGQYQQLARQQFAGAMTAAGLSWTEVDSAPSARALCERSGAAGYGVLQLGNGLDLVYILTSGTTAQVAAALTNDTGAFFTRL